MEQLTVYWILGVSAFMNSRISGSEGEILLSNILYLVMISIRLIHKLHQCICINAMITLVKLDHIYTSQQYP